MEKDNFGFRHVELEKFVRQTIRLAFLPKSEPHRGLENEFRSH